MRHDGVCGQRLYRRQRSRKEARPEVNSQRLSLDLLDLDLLFSLLEDLREQDSTLKPLHAIILGVLQLSRPLNGGASLLGLDLGLLDVKKHTLFLLEEASQVKISER